MPKGLKPTSSLIQISGSVGEETAGVFNSERIDLQLNALDNEVFVVQSIDLDVALPDNRTDTQTFATMTLSSTARTAVGSLTQPSTMAYLRREISNVGDTCAVIGE